MNRILGAVLATGLASAPASAQTDAISYLAKAGAGDLYEIESSQLVLATTRNPTIRDFATRMIADHRASTATVKAAAAQADVRPAAPKLTSDQERLMADLKKAVGADRDKLYLRQQHGAHQQALTLHQSYAASGDDPALKGAAQQIVTVVKAHISSMPDH